MSKKQGFYSANSPVWRFWVFYGFCLVFSGLGVPENLFRGPFCCLQASVNCFQRACLRILCVFYSANSPVCVLVLGICFWELAFGLLANAVADLIHVTGVCHVTAYVRGAAEIFCQLSPERKL